MTARAIAEEAGVDDFLAEATPEDQMKLIRDEQTGGKLVAMTGDGTNDAPALAQSDVGVAMNTGTSAAKEAGNMVDLDSNPTKLIEIVEIGKQLLITRLASIKALVSTLRSSDVSLSATDQAELLGAIEESTDRLGALVDNLLDMSRLGTGTIRPLLAPVGWDEVVPAALRGLPEDAALTLDVPESLPAVIADAGRLERVVANVVENAVKYSPPGVPVLIAGSAIGHRAELRVIDRGPGVPDDSKAAIFEPFQRLGDVPRGTGVGLGLAVARGFTEAMGGALTAEDTPGGGLTMVIALPLAEVVSSRIPVDGEPARVPQ